MSGERKRILEMVATGRLTPEQADQLLEALPAGKALRVGVTPRPAPTGPRVDAEELIGLAALGVDASYVRKLRAFGLHDVTPESAMGLAVLGVDPSYAGQMVELLSGIDSDQICGLAALGVQPSYVEDVLNYGPDDLTVDQIMSMHVMGVDPADAQRLEESFAAGEVNDE